MLHHGGRQQQHIVSSLVDALCAALLFTLNNYVSQANIFRLCVTASTQPRMSPACFCYFLLVKLSFRIVQLVLANAPTSINTGENPHLVSLAAYFNPSTNQ